MSGRKESVQERETSNWQQNAKEWKVQILSYIFFTKIIIILMCIFILLDN